MTEWEDRSGKYLAQGHYRSGATESQIFSRPTRLSVSILSYNGFVFRIFLTERARIKQLAFLAGP